MRLRDHNSNQDFGELVAFVEYAIALDVRRYLEIGSRNGDSFFAVMGNLQPGAFGMSIDIPESAGSEVRLRTTAAEIEGFGSVARVVFESSRTEIAKGLARVAAPFDLVLIDGDHRYDGVKADWLDYGHLASVVAFHDVAAPDGHMSDFHSNEVGRFWRELKADLRVTSAKIIEITMPGSCMGFGIIDKRDCK